MSFPSQEHSSSLQHEDEGMTFAHTLFPVELCGQIIDQSSDCIIILDLDGSLLSINRGGLQTMDIDDFSTFQSQSWLSFWSGEGFHHAENALNIVRSGGSETFEGEALTARGNLKWLEVTVAPLRDEQGNVSHLLAISRDITERKHIQLALAEQARLGRLSLAVSYALSRHSSLHSMLTDCTQALVDHLDTSFARIWVFDATQDILVLHASSGLYTHLDGAHGKIPMGAFKIGRIAQSREPHLTNNVLEDEHIPEKEWARREGMIAFAGYPLLLSEQVIGVVAMFATHPLSPSILDAMAAIANSIAIGIHHQQGEQERLHLLEATQQARLEAEVALSIRNKFLSSVSHDLKTPLAVLKGNLQLIQRLLRRKPLEEGAWMTERLGIMEKTLTKMTGMIDDLLNISRLRASEHIVEGFVSFDLLPLLRAAVLEQQSTTRRHQLMLTTHCEALPVHGNAVRLDRAINNLLDNAIKYSPEGGDILLEVTEEYHDGQPWVQLSVTDHGIGIPAADLAHIFTPFQRASNVIDHIQGTGIGLASVSEIIEQHHGTITVTSEEGQGSQFRVSLPLAFEIDKK